MHLFTGLPGGRIALYFKTHHGLIDGIGFIRILSGTVSPTKAAGKPRAIWEGLRADPPRRPGRTAPTGDRISLTGLGDLAREAGRTVGDLGRILLHQAERRMGRGPGLAMPFVSTPNVLRTRAVAEPRAGALHRPARPRPRHRAPRRGEGQRRDAGGGRRRAQSIPRGTRLAPDRPLVADVPVALVDHGGAGNRITILQVPMGTPGIRAGGEAGGDRRRDADDEARGPLGVGQQPRPLLHPRAHGREHVRGARARAAPLLANVVVSNPAGLDRRMYFNGAAVELALPVSVVAHQQVLNVTVTTYVDDLHVTLMAQREAIPDLRKLAGYIAAAVERLETEVGGAAARRTRAKPRPQRRRAPARPPSIGSRRRPMSPMPARACIAHEAGIAARLAWRAMGRRMRGPRPAASDDCGVSRELEPWVASLPRDIAGGPRVPLPAGDTGRRGSTPALDLDAGRRGDPARQRARLRLEAARHLGAALVPALVPRGQRGARLPRDARHAQLRRRQARAGSGSGAISPANGPTNRASSQPPQSEYSERKRRRVGAGPALATRRGCLRRPSSRPPPTRDCPAIVAAEARRLQAPPDPPPTGWNYLWFLGPAEIYRPSVDRDRPRLDPLPHAGRHGDSPARCAARARARRATQVALAGGRTADGPGRGHPSVARLHEHRRRVRRRPGHHLLLELVAAGRHRRTAARSRPGPAARRTSSCVPAASDLGTWLAEERDLHADYTRLVGGPARAIVRVWLIANSLLARGRAAAASTRGSRSSPAANESRCCDDRACSGRRSSVLSRMFLCVERRDDAADLVVHRGDHRRVGAAAGVGDVRVPVEVLLRRLIRRVRRIEGEVEVERRRRVVLLDQLHGLVAEQRRST